MDKEKSINILMSDGCTRSEAEKFLKNGAVVYPDFENNFPAYMADRENIFSDHLDFLEYVESMREIMEKKSRGVDCAWTFYGGNWYFIEYSV